jgi:hypothetical protein
MSITMMLVRELAAWGLDQDVYRPPDCRGNPDSANAVLTKGARFETESALMEFDDGGLRERVREQEACFSHPYRRPPLSKTLRITVEESYTIRGENL